MKKAVFLDRDGVINHLVDRGETFVGEHGKPIRWTAPFTLREVRLKQGALSALDSFRQKGYLCILVTNQPDVALGHIDPNEFQRIMNVFRAMPFAAIFACTHKPSEGCACHKPKPGMLINACATFEIDMARSWMIGDQKSDILAGKAAGVRTIQLLETVEEETLADYRATSLLEAAGLV